MKTLLTEWKQYLTEAVGEVSSGVLLYKKENDQYLFYLVHAGGPYNQNNRYAWGIPKGHVEKGESLKLTAEREFEEEMGIPLPNKLTYELGSITTRSGKQVYAFACEGNLPNDFKPKANMINIRFKGQIISIPEIDEGAWLSVEEAEQTINPSYMPFIHRLLNYLES